jgi:hypothetical protein
MRPVRSLCCQGATLLLVGLVCRSASAHAAGFAVSSCGRCHQGGREPLVTLTADPIVPDGGSATTLSVRITRTNGGYGGFYLSVDRKGSFTLIGGAIRLASPFELVHSAPAFASDGDILFQALWNAPPGKGGVNFSAWGVSANGDGNLTGDGAGSDHLSLTYGCPGVRAYVDLDGDGYGRDIGATRLCQIVPGYAAIAGDCDDTNKDVHPGAPEVCGEIDTNCDRESDRERASCRGGCAIAPGKASPWGFLALVTLAILRLCQRALAWNAGDGLWEQGTRERHAAAAKTGR